MKVTNKEIEPIKVAVGYVRTSGLINPKTSIPNQKLLIEEYCEKEKLFLKTIYVDEAISGTSINDRFAYQELRRELIKGQINVVLTSFSNRLGREMYEFTTLVSDLKELGVEFISISEGLKASEMNTVSLAVTGIMVEMENVQRTRAITDGKRRTEAAGKFAYKAPYGYTKENGYLKIQEDEASDITFIFQSFLSGQSISDIAQSLKQNNRRRNNGSSWTYSHIYSILQNKNYTGTFYKKVGKEPGDIQKVPTVAFPGFITEEEFEIIQDLLKVSKRKSTNTSHFLSGIFYCPTCHKKVYGTKKPPTYSCTNKCEIYPKDDLEAKVLAYLSSNESEEQNTSFTEQRRIKLLEDKDRLETRFARGNIGIGEFQDKLELIKMELEDAFSDTYEDFISENQYDYYVKRRDFTALKKLLKINKVKLTMDSNGDITEL